MRNIGFLVIIALAGITNNAFSIESQNSSLATSSVVAATSAALAATASAVAATSAAIAATSAINAAASATAAASPKDNNDWTGDHLQIKGNLEGLTKICDRTNPKIVCDDKYYFAPAFVRFDVAKENKDGTILITPRDNYTYLPAEKMIKVTPWEGHGPYGWLSIGLWGKDIETPVTPEQHTVVRYDTYTINKKEIENIPYVKYGWTYGALVVPFKYQRDAKTISFAPSYQLYLGYKRDSNGTAEGPFLSAGFTTADIPTGAGTSTNKQAFSYGGGWIFEIKKDRGIQLLIMAGQDKFGAGSGYAYESDTWYSVSIGLSLDPQTTK